MSILKKKIGVIGGGQLGKMMILEAKRLGFYVVILDPAADCPASSISDEQIVAGFDTEEGYAELAKKVDVITYEFEHINAKALENLEKQGHVIYPSVASLKTIQNKYLQKLKLQGEGVLVPLFAKVATVDDIREHGKEGNFGYPMMLKTTTGGYDGKGNALIRNESEVETAFATLGSGKKELMVEAFVDFDMEISVTACRGIDGERVIYPIAENMHRNSILDVSIVPARVSEATIEKATQIAGRVMEVFAGVGTFCVEMFVAKNGDVYVNEVAPRPHNSGHYTIEGCFANQFENHIRGIVGLPFGSTDLISPTVMVNLLGESDGEARLLGVEEAYLDPKVQVHFYGKPESKEFRKMGHFTVVDSTVEGAIDRALKLKEIVKVVGE
ncbi:MAG: 5-(carboxyamino)imidazole ribonucleotide synthase [Defluviitaleaceae bacterium]|nr:5-(carboxyamino)imidazole ribonucleotide synthase [Defluviitaleaceae bacterium]